jgi:hypothetical protein
MQPSLVDGAGGGKWQKVAPGGVIERLGGLAGKLMNREVEGSAFFADYALRPNIAVPIRRIGLRRQKK